VSDPELSVDTETFRRLGYRVIDAQVHGVDAFQRAIAHGIDLAEHAERMLANDPRWEVVTPAQLGIVTFRLAGDASVVDGHTRGLVAALAADGHAYISYDRGARAHRAAPVHRQPAHDVRRRGGDDRTTRGARGRAGVGLASRARCA
jgi:hypothetical protein